MENAWLTNSGAGNPVAVDATYINVLLGNDYVIIKIMPLIALNCIVFIISCLVFYHLTIVLY